jgi:1-acyl-sn-glycerol-3-phosphate acyltransferase
VLSSISAWILKTLGWTIRLDLPDLKKYVVIAAPHTSNWDFLLGILFAKASNLKVTWMGKHSIFRWPFGWLFRALGGTPVHRDKGRNYIDQMTDLFSRSEYLILALAPEGTRSKTDHWKTGFLYIARAAQVPVVLGFMDYGKKEVGMGNTYYLGDSIETDFENIKQFYADIRGKIPEQESLIQMRKRK